MANPYAAVSPLLQARQGAQGVVNPYATWHYWKPPTSELDRAYYTQNPDEAELLYAQAYGGSPGGSLEDFIRKALVGQRADYVRQNMAQPGLMRTDTMTPGLADQYWRQWQAQTPYQRGENHDVLGAGRYTG